MLISIHDANLRKVGFLDNESQGALNFYNDTWSQYLETGTSTFEFTVDKKILETDTANHRAYEALNNRSFVSFKYQGKSYLFNVMKTVEDSESITCYCENLTLELLNEYANAYAADKAYSFVEYCNHFGIIKNSALTVGVNEISDQKRKLSWDGQDTLLKRLLSLANNFDAEISFESYLKDDSSLKEFCLNVYKENDLTHQGVGQRRTDIILNDGVEISRITKTVDKTTVFNLIYPTGNEKTVTHKVTKTRMVDKQITVGSGGATNTENALKTIEGKKGQRVGSGQCYGLVALYSSLLGGPGLGGGVTGISGRIGGGIAAGLIGTDYNWKAFGWSVVGASAANMKTGAIVNIKANYGQPFLTGPYGHTAIVKAVSGSTVTILEQNYAGRMYVVENSYNLSAYVAGVQTIVYPPELVQGKTVGGSTTTKTVKAEEKYTEDVKETVKTVIDAKKTQEWKNADGEVEFYLKNGQIYAPLSRELFPSVLTGTETNDNWIRKDITVNTESEEVLISTALKQIRNSCYSQVSFEIDGDVELNIGDTVKARSSKFSPALTLEVRVSELHKSFTEPDNNKAVFANFKELQSQVSSSLLAQMEQMAEAARPYTIKFSSDNGMTFKNHQGETTVIATLQKGNRDIKANWKWSVNNELLSSTDSLTISASGFEKTLTVAVAAIVGEQVVTTDQITFTNINDGAGIKKITPLYGSSENGETTDNWSTDAKAATKSEPYVLGKFITELTDGTQIETNNFVAAVRSPEFDEVERFKQGIYKDFEEVDAQLTAQSEAHNQAVAEILAQATSTEDLATEAKRIGEQAVADAISLTTQLNTAKSSLQNQINKAQTDVNQTKQDLLTQANQLSTARQALQSEIETAKTQAGDVSKALDTAKAELEANVATVNSKAEQAQADVNQTKKDLQSHANQLNAQATKQEELTKLTTETKKLVDGQITTISELSKTVAQNGKDITSVQSRTKTVEETLSGTKTTLEQVKATAENTSQKTAEIESGIDGLNSKFEELKVADTSFEQSLATYQQSAERNLADLQSTIQTLDGRVTGNKSSYDQDASKIATRLSSLETYKNDEGTRESKYFEASKTETARQLIAERTSIANNYVAKSVYTEDANGTELRLSATEKVANSAKTNADTAVTNAETVKSNLAEYKVLNNSAVANLQQSIKDANGNISDLKTSVGLVPGKISAAVEAVEAKIPTSVVGNNIYAISNNSTIGTNHISGFNQDITTGIISFNTTGSDPYIGRAINHPTTYIPAMGIKIPVIQRKDISIGLTNSLFTKNYVQYFKNDGNSAKNFKSYPSHKFTVPASELAGVDFITFRYGIGNPTYSIGDKIDTRVKVEYGNANTDWTPATEDLLTEISNAKTIIQTTAEGQTQLSTKVEQQGKTLVSNTADIKTLNDKVALTVTKTTFDNLEKRTTTAETAISTQAGEISKRLTSTQVESAITAKGYQTKAQVDSNIDGRGLVKTSDLSNYVKTTTYNNQVTETAKEYTRLISETQALIPSGEPNLVPKGRPEDGVTKMGNLNVVTHGFYYNGNLKLYRLTTSGTSEFTQRFEYFPVERNTDYTLYFKGFNNPAVTHMEVWFLKRVKGSANDWDEAQRLINNRKLSISRAEEITVTFNSGDYDEGYIRFDNNGTTAQGTSADLYFGDVCVKKGKSNNGWSPAVADLTTVTAFNKVSETVDEYKRLISSGGSLSKAIQSAEKFEKSIASGGDIYQAIQTAKGLATTVSGANGLSTQVSQLAGSYAVKNLTSSGQVLSQLNLSKDGSVKIDGSLVRITGKTVIDNGVIKSAMIANGQIGTAQIGTIDGATANIININAKNISADGLSGNVIKGGTLRSTNSATNFDLVNGKLNFDTDTASVRRVTSGIPTQFVKFLKSSNGALTVIGSNRDGSESADNDSFAGFKIYSSNTKEVSEIISDQIYFLTGANNRRGWQMSTITGSDNKQISLFPTGDPTKSMIYASDYYIKRNDKNIALIDFITYVNACLKHLQNHTGRTDIWNGFDI